MTTAPVPASSAPHQNPGGFHQNRQDSLPAAVLFDLDGTLLDSEPLWFEAERLLVGEYGQPWGPVEGRQLVGWSLWDSATFLREQVGVDLPQASIIERLQSHVVAGVVQAPPWRPGALELLAEVRAAGVPTALVTMSYRQMTDVVVAALPAGSLGAVVSGDQVSRGKPHPDPYLLAAQRLGVAARDCVAIEDSETGATSALEAGCAVLVVPVAGSVAGLTGVTVRTSLLGMSLAGLSEILQADQARRGGLALSQSGSSAGSSTGTAASG
ncbi:MAG: HAD family phosphatase [Geodermatophilaceae bacterium]|nr:HAD family phosphatase [Geodermatophilaceae bacterium]